MGRQIGEVGNPVSRLGCGAAIIERSKILLVKRKRNPEKNHWGLPGGKVEPDEGVEDAIAREINEELGISIKLHRLICTVSHLDASTGQRWTAPVYSASIMRGTPKICEPHTLAGVNWFAINRLPGPLTAATLQTLDALGGELSVTKK
jgi:ADP-ribose pyrophosphatase YjhB (NUDIX family)